MYDHIVPALYFPVGRFLLQEDGMAMARLAKSLWLLWTNYPCHFHLVGVKLYSLFCKRFIHALCSAEL